MEVGKKKMSDDAVKLNDFIMKTFNNINCKEMEEVNFVENAWKKTLLSIKGANEYEGQNLYDHSKIVDLKNKVLLIETDHPGWIQMLQFRKKYIVNGLNRNCPQLEINSLAFKLKGKEASLAKVDEDNSVENTKSKIENRIKEEEKALNNEKFNENSAQKKELPPELKAIFEDLEKSMLTNSKK